MSPLPEYMTPLDETTLRDRTLARLPASRDRSQGGFAWDIIAAVMVEAALEDDRIRFVNDLTYAGTTFGEFLDRRAEEHGVLRRLATPATGDLEWTGAPGTDIPQGTEYSTAGSDSVPAQRYRTDVDAVVPAGGVVLVPSTALEPGNAGNVAADTITIPGAAPIPGITGVTNPDPFTGGTDDETDEDLLIRYFDRVRNPSSSGNVADYRRWALEVAGVGRAAVVPLEDGPGTVTVAIVDTDLGVPAGPLVAAVQAYIDPGGAGLGTGQAPIGAAVDVEAAAAVPIDLAADLTAAPGYIEANVQADAEQSVRDYFSSLTFEDDNDVRHARVVTAILDTPGVLDAQNVLINGAAANIAIGTKELATLDAVVWT